MNLIEEILIKMAKKGTHLSETTKEKIRLSLLGKRKSMGTEWARGHVPWNKGTKGIMKRNKGCFKKGNIPNNYMGGYKICNDDGIYVRIKGEDYVYDNGKRKGGKYQSLARVKYAEYFGDFDKKLIVFHKDGDVFNNQKENLELITNGELLKRNGYNKSKIKKCSICGKDFFYRINKHKTCSKKCYKENCKILNGKWKKKNKEKVNLINRNYKKRKRAERINMLIDYHNLYKPSKQTIV